MTGTVRCPGCDRTVPVLPARRHRSGADLPARRRAHALDGDLGHPDAVRCRYPVEITPNEENPVNVTMRIPTPVRDVVPGHIVEADYGRHLQVSDVEIHMDSVDLWGRRPSVSGGQRSRIVTKRDDIVARVPTREEAEIAWSAVLAALDPGLDIDLAEALGVEDYQIRVELPDGIVVVIGDPYAMSPDDVIDAEIVEDPEAF